MSRVLNVLVTGVGGQGLLTLSSVLAEAALRRGLGVVVAETHGMSQRGGIVTVHVRLGRAEAPLIPSGAVDVLLGMELIEAARHAYTLSERSMAVVNDYVVPPPYPGVKVPSRDSLIAEISKKAAKFRVVPATAVAVNMGDARVANMVLLGAAAAAGAFSGFLDVKDLEAAIARVLSRAAGRNLEAFQIGTKLQVSASAPPV
ncbi:MAG: 2-oxoacid:acceptor oxidoreductase family protein [Thermoproteota archaeon]